ncbi:MAG: hypothetical protein ABIB71_04865 [Candidatus Woesearchaeota archaeon]
MLMALIALGLGVILLVMAVKNFKHHMVRKGFKYVLVIVLFIVGLFALNLYVDVGDLLDTGKGLTDMTGAAVKDAFEESFSTNAIGDVAEKVEDLAGS